jgi:hypothetical protein
MLILFLTLYKLPEKKGKLIAGPQQYSYQLVTTNYTIDNNTNSQGNRDKFFFELWIV